MAVVTWAPASSTGAHDASLIYTSTAPPCRRRWSGKTTITLSGLCSSQKGKDFAAVFVRKVSEEVVGFITAGFVILGFMFTVSWLMMRMKMKKWSDFDGDEDEDEFGWSFLLIFCNCIDEFQRCGDFGLYVS